MPTGMATVPGVLIIGDGQVQGYTAIDPVQAKVSSLGVSDVSDWRDLRLMRVTPDNESTGAPTASSLSWWPWYDGTAEQGTSSSGIRLSSAVTATSITFTPDPGWTTNEHAGRQVSVANASGIGLTDRRIIQSNTSDTVVVTSWLTTPIAGQYGWVGEGRWTDYHPVSGWLTATEAGSTITSRGGGSWQANGLGIGMDGGLVRKLWEDVFPNPPYYQIAKFAFGGTPTVGGWDDGGSIRSSFEDELARMEAAWTERAGGNTLQWQYVVLDHSQTDVNDWITTPANYLLYQNAIEEWIAYLRTTLSNASLGVVIVNHDPELRNVDAPGGTLLANRVHRAVAIADPLVRCAVLTNMRTKGEGPLQTSLFQPSEDRIAYSPHEYWTTVADKVSEAIKMLSLGNPTTYEGSIAVDINIGDSIEVGNITESFTQALNSPTLTGTTRSAKQGIWNRGNQAVEAYDLGDNSNTSGTVSISGGAELSQLPDLEEQHPVVGVVLIKRGSNGSGLASSAAAYDGNSNGRWAKSYGEHYDELLEDVTNCFAYINNVLGRQAHLRSINVTLGTNDCTTLITDGGTAFADALETFVSDLRTDLSTVTNGVAVPITWVRPQLGYAGSDDDEVRIARAALADLEDEDASFRIIDCDDLERDATDGIHLTPESLITVGQRRVAARVAIDAANA